MWKNILEAKGFKLSMVKMEYLKYNFSNKACKNEGEVR